MNDPDETITWTLGIGSDLPEALLAHDEQAVPEDRSVTDFLGGLVSLGYIRAALKRKAWVWCATAILGLIIGAGLYKHLPPSYQASTSVLITNNPDQDPATAIETDIVLAQSDAVAAGVIHNLGLHQSVASFIAASTVTATTDEVLLMTVNAPSSSDAVSRANALAAEFLSYRASVLQTQQQLLKTTLDQQVDQAQKQLSALEAQVTSEAALPATPSQQAELSILKRQRTTETNSLNTLEQGAAGQEASGQVFTSSMVQGSQVLNPATPGKHSKLKLALEYVGTALVAGWALGLAIVIIQAVVSDRLRRRDDVAEALGAPVRLSIATARATHWLPARRRRKLRDKDLQRLVAHLRRTVPGSSRGAATLAVVAIDNGPLVAPAVASLAASYEREGRHAVVADLSDGALARVLGVRGSGISTVSFHGTQLSLVVPQPDDVFPAGPVGTTLAPGQPASTNTELLAACASADVVLTLATVDPAFGADHLATWATDAVAVVTAGRSPAARIGAVGEMIRVAGVSLTSAVLLEADPSDDSLGTVHAAPGDVPSGPDFRTAGL